MTNSKYKQREGKEGRRNSMKYLHSGGRFWPQCWHGGWAFLSIALLFCYCICSMYSLPSLPSSCLCGLAYIRKSCSEYVILRTDSNVDLVVLHTIFYVIMHQNCYRSYKIHVCYIDVYFTMNEPFIYF